MRSALTTLGIIIGVSAVIALVSIGQGAQSVGMGRDLAAQFPAAQQWFDHSNNVLGYDLAQICFEGPSM